MSLIGRGLILEGKWKNCGNGSDGIFDDCLVSIYMKLLNSYMVCVFGFEGILQKDKYFGSMVKRLRHRPFTAVTRVRFPLESLWPSGSVG